jgi:probable O-glycosylation ligase (exosortase A-associated)
MRGLLLLSVITCILFLGFRAPYVFILGYVWASIFTPQFVAYNIITSLPISFIFAFLAAGSLLLVKREERIEFRIHQSLLLILAAWMTVTLVWAEVPSAAYQKWDPAFKTVAFTALMPLFFRTRIQVEMLVWTIALAGVAHCMPFAVKVALSGGGYGMQLGLIEANSGFGESSTLSMFAVMLIPLCMYLYKHQTIIPFEKLTKLFLIGLMGACVLTSVGTYARTGLVSLLALGFFMIIRTKYIFRNIAIVIALVGVGYIGVSDDWLQRMTTIGDATESSAMGRVAIWKWVLQYIAVKPWGGSFGMYLISSYDLMLVDGEILSIKAKAYHSIYFEILGEVGIPGFLMFVALTLISFASLRSVRRGASESGAPWLSDLADNITLMFIVYLAGGLFIGVGFQVMFFYLVAFAAVLLNLLTRLNRSNQGGVNG